MQVVGYETAVQEHGPALLLGNGGQIDRVPLTQGTELCFGLGERHCAGTVAADEHKFCDNPAAPYCREHTDYWPCAVCRGNCTKPLPNCDRPHVVYLAAFAPDTFKVGVTKPSRLFARFHEQGADRAAVIESHPDGREARRRETAIAQGISDSVRVDTKRSGMHRTVDEAAWDALLEQYAPMTTYTFDYDIKLDQAPIPETVAYGVVHGTKGRILLLCVEETTYGVDLRSLVGYELTEAPSQGRQTSLSTY